MLGIWIVYSVCVGGCFFSQRLVLGKPCFVSSIQSEKSINEPHEKAYILVTQVTCLNDQKNINEESGINMTRLRP